MQDSQQGMSCSYPCAELLLLVCVLQSDKSLYMLWPDGTCSQMGVQGTVNTSIITALQAMVNASNSAPAAALLNNRISSLGSAAGSSAATSQVSLQLIHGPTQLQCGADYCAAAGSLCQLEAMCRNVSTGHIAADQKPPECCTATLTCHDLNDGMSCRWLV